MNEQVAENLFRVLLVSAMVLLLILLVNNFVYYRRKIKDDISVMIILCFVTCLFELLWALTNNHIQLAALTYIFGIGFTLSAVAFASMFSRFFLKFFGCYPKKKWLLFLIYVLPNVLMFGFCVSTPWTHLVFSMTEDGYLVEEIVFNTAFYLFILAYFFSSLIIAIHYLIRYKQNQKVTKKIIYMLIGFDIVAPLALILQYVFLGFDSDYIALSLCLALALTFLVSNLSTLLLVDSEAKMREIETDLKIAAKIQESALPPIRPDFENKFHVALRASMRTAKEVGGDFYDYFPIDDKRICFLIADVSGKGTPAALFMMTAKTVIKDHALIYNDTSKIFSLVNSRLHEGNKETMFATSWIAILDLEKKTLQYTNAGHNYPLLYRKNGEIQCLKKVDGLFLGVMDGLPYQSNTINVEEGDRILLYTDGVTEAHNVANELYGEERLIKVFTDNIDKNDEEIINIIFDDIAEFSKGARQFDDITMMSLTIK